MSIFTRSFLALCCAFCSFATQISAQNLALVSSIPNDLYVCGTGQVLVTVQNSAGSPTATPLRLSIVFPTGITYVPNSVSGGGATDFNITNLNAPVFQLQDLTGGSVADLTLNVQVGCDLVDLINAGQLFNNTLTATYGSGSKQVVFGPYPVRTGLANIISVAPMAVSAMQGDVIMRTVTVKNTSSGPIESLSFRDVHAAGITIDIPGSANQIDAPTLYRSDIPGSYFMAFGDHDNLLENSDGEITIVEKITVTDCGASSYSVSSDIKIGFGCGGNTCRSDSTTQQPRITILPSNQNPHLKFKTQYARPLSYCGAVPSVQEIHLINDGQLPAQNVSMDISVFNLDTTFMGLDSASFEWSLNGVNWQPVEILTVDSTFLGSCQLDQYFKRVAIKIPLVPAGDSVRLRYDSYFCLPVCLGLYPRMQFFFSYLKSCPLNDPVNGLQTFFPDTTFLSVTSEINFDIGHCLESDSIYPDLIYWVKSKRLTVDTGVLQILIELPFGIEWDPTCDFNLDGQTPLEFGTTVDGNGTTTVRAVFDLPFSQDSVADDHICIKYHCAAGLPCEPAVANVPPRGLDYIVYPPPSDCDGCELKFHTYSTIALHKDDTKECGITACDEFNMVVDDICNGGSGGPASIVSGSANLAAGIGFDSWRVNKGFEDTGDSRRYNSNNTAKASDVRLDRFITGDTLRNELRIGIQAGNLTDVNYRLFMESLSSDFGMQDGDAYDLIAGKKLFVNTDTTEFVGGHIIIKKAGAAPVVCDIAVPKIRSDQHYIQVAEPNIRPPDIKDEFTNMFDQFSFNLAKAIDNGCLAAGTTLVAGDSLFFQTDYKFTNNFIPAGNSEPPLINFRTSICDTLKTYAWELTDFCTDRPIRQYSGFVEQISRDTQVILPCDVSFEKSPFRYRIRLARENMFPKEIRPLTSIFNYLYSLPTNVGLLSTKLNFLKLQENDVLFSNQSLTPTYTGNDIKLDLDPFFNKPLDEGYSFEISTKFDTTCGYNGTQFGSTVLGVRYANECLHNPVSVNYEIDNPNAYINGSPELDFFNSGPNIIYIPTTTLSLSFTIRNSSDAAKAINPWIIIDSDHNLTDVELLLNNSPVPSVGGVYQLDTIQPFGSLFFKLRAKNTSCRSYTLNFRYGWGCKPTYNDQANICGEFLGSVEIRPQPPELDLIIQPEPQSIPLCTPSEDFEFEIANALDGSAYHVVPTVKLPPGFQIVPGSARVSYPAGDPPVALPPPVVLPGNIWQFDPEAIPQFQMLRDSGLVTFEREPKNAMRILFKVRAECGAVANARFIYGAEAVQPCGIASNRLRIPGDPIGITGVNAVNSAAPYLHFTNPTAAPVCGKPIEITATIQLIGAPSAGDSIYINLPIGTSYVAGSYTPGTDAPLGPPTVIGQNMQLPLPTNLGSIGSLEFTFSIRYDDAAGCTDRSITIQTREKTQAVCGNTECDVYVATGDYILPLNAQNPELQLNNFLLQTSANGQTTFSANLENAGTATATNPVVKLYNDLNMNGVIDPSEPLIETVTINGTITPGATLGISGNLTLPVSEYCNIIALIPAAENCACTDMVFPVGGSQVVTKGIGLCAVQPVDVGTPIVQGSTYTWQTTANMSCVNCNMATYTPGPEVHPGDLVTLILFETTGNCVIERRFEIQFGGSFGVETSDSTIICQGYSTTLEATAGGVQYSWSGPDIANANLQNQTVTPNTSGTFTYSVQVTFAGGCTGSGTVEVIVKPGAATNIDTTTCAGTPIELFPNLVTDVPGIYKRTLPAVNSCDSVVTITLRVPESHTDSLIFICPGDSAKAYTLYFKTDGMECLTFTTAEGCDSTACIKVRLAQTQNIPAQDSVIVQAHTEITLDGPGGFTTYQWSPPTTVPANSTNEDYVITPDSTTTFLLALTDGNGCRDTVEYRVVTCDLEKYIKTMMPNAFTPNGDGANDVFKPVDREGAEQLVSLLVYDRWGTKVYEGRGKDAGWDGMIKDKPASSDVYVYIITAECSGIQRKESGEVTLLR